MTARPTYEDIRPHQTGPFSTRQRRDDIRRVKSGYYPGIVPLPGEFDAKQMVSTTAVAAIRKAFTLAKTSRDSWRTGSRYGRVDIRQAPRAVRGEQDVFKAKRGQSTTRVRCAVLLDASGSMSQGKTQIEHPAAPGQTVTVSNMLGTAVFGATIAEAIGRVPTVDLDVYQHGASGDHLTIKWRWSKGTPIAVFNEAASGIRAGGGNADGHAVYAIAEKMHRESKRGERGVILVVSDGLPSQTPLVPAGYGTEINQQRERLAKEALVAAVAHARKLGIEVIAVAIDGSSQEALYGKEHYIPFTGNWTALGSALARVLGSALARR